MKKVLIGIVCVMMAVTVMARPPHHRHHHGGRGYNGLAMAADIVSICANGAYLANQLSSPRVVYAQPAYAQPVYTQPVYAEPVVYSQPVYQTVPPRTVVVQPQPVYQQPVQYYTPITYAPSTVIVRERRPFILTRIVDAILP